MAEIARMRKLSLHDDEFEFFKNVKIARFMEFGLSSDVVQRCREWQPKINFAIASSLCSQSSVQRVPSCRLVGPYHETLRHGMIDVLAGIQSNINISMANVVGIHNLMLGWRNSPPPLFLVLRRMRL